MSGFGLLRRILATALVAAAASSASAEDGMWSVGKSSGEVWITTTDAQPASLKQEEVLKPGDTIRTGRNGRVLLSRGEETILIAPNSVVGVPAEKKEGLSTTIVQQAGSILLEVEKRNVKHFEVETPYLAAVVKGTQFSVTVNAASTTVEVRRGQVEVSDFKSGQIAQVMPGQAATAFAHGKGGFSLSGSGTFNPIEQGKPRASSIERVPVPKSGLSAPLRAANGGFIHAIGHLSTTKIGAAAIEPQRMSGDTRPSHKGMRISAALGEVRLNFHKVTQGLAHGAVAPASGTKKDLLGSDSKVATAGASGQSQGNSSVGANAAGSASGNAAGNGATTSPSGLSSPGGGPAGGGPAGAGPAGGGPAGGGSVISVLTGLINHHGNGNANGNGNGNGNFNGKGNGNH
jgi:FecR-like protein